MKTQNEYDMSLVHGGFEPLGMGPDWWNPVYVPPQVPSHVPPTFLDVMAQVGVVADM